MSSYGEDPRELQKAWSTWLSAKATWTHLATLTFAPRWWESDTPSGMPSSTRVLRAASKLQVRLTRAVDAPSFFGVVEVGGMNGRMHLHCLLCSEDERFIRAAIEEHRLKEGFVDVRPISSVGGVAGYVTKYVVKQHDPIWIAGGPAWRN